MDWNALSLLPSPQAAPCMPLGLLLVAVQSTKENYERRPRSFFVLNIDNMLHIDRSFLTKTRTIRFVEQLCRLFRFESTIRLADKHGM